MGVLSILFFGLIIEVWLFLSFGTWEHLWTGPLDTL
jgi:hypothetical protein